MRSRLSPYVAIARPEHWIKHVFILPGLLIAHLLDSSAEIDLLSITAGLSSACLLASANYVINEFLDAEFDRFHPTKKRRMAVVLSLRVRYVLLEYAVLLVVGLALASLVNTYFLWAAAVFAFMAVLYNVRPIRLKDRFVIDVLSESINNPLRLFFGWFMVTSATVPPTSIVLAFWFGGAFLMAAKRFSEYRYLVAEVPLTEVISYRKSFGRYSEATLVGSMFSYAMLCGFMISAFILIYRIEYFLTFPLLVTLFTYYVVFSFDRDSPAQAPEKLHKNGVLITTVSVLVASFVFLTFVDIPVLEAVLTSQAIEIEAIRDRLLEVIR